MQGQRATTSVWPEFHLRGAGAPRQTLMLDAHQSWQTLGVGVVSTHPSLGGVCDGSRSQAAAWSAETMAPKVPRKLAASRGHVGPFECWSPGARQEGRQVPFVSRAKAVTTTFSCTEYFGVVLA
jgi:hypothetical protein